MPKWTYPTKTVTNGGWFQIQVTAPGYSPTDVTYFRSTPTQLSSYSNADPFGDSTCQISFPQITAFDDFRGIEFRKWLQLFANVDIYWVPWMYSTKTPPAGVNFTKPKNSVFVNPISGKQDSVAPESYYTIGEVKNSRLKLWEGFIVSMDFEAGDNSHSLSVQCQGALFQMDRYLQKPFFPPRPIPFEKIFYREFSPKEKPHLRTKNLQISWPDDWAKKIPARGKNQNSAYVVEGKAGENWTGYATRQTGSWDKTLTGFIQNQLSLMIVQKTQGAVAGDHWTILQKRQTSTSPGRTPILLVRSGNRVPDFSIWVGTPGLTCNFTRDGTQMSQIVYGQGTSLDGTPWNNSRITPAGNRTDYEPLAWNRGVYPYTSTRNFAVQPMVAESYIQFGTGFDQEQASDTAEQMLQRDLDPGFTGTITLKTDPSPTFSRWAIRSGMTVNLKGLAGSSTDGVNFHIGAVEASPFDGTVNLTVDTRYRDLLTINEARERTRDALTPIRMLQANKYSVLIEDLNKPWSYSAGSGFIPTESRLMWKKKPSNVLFPYRDLLKKYPPKYKKAQFYVTCKANAKARKDRWVLCPILTAEKGTIRRTEIFCVDHNGNILKIPFHVSFWSLKVTPGGMPRDKDGPSPYINNAFTTVNPATGLPWPQSSYLIPQPGLIATYGGRINNQYNRAGFYPGSELTGAPASGIFVTDEPISFDNTQTTDKGYDPNVTVNNKQTAKSVTIYAMFYAEYKQPVYFHGRMYKQTPAGGS